MNSDLIEWIRAELAKIPSALPLADPVLTAARQTWGGDKVYIRIPRQTVSRRTLQRRQQVARQSI